MKKNVIAFAWKTAAALAAGWLVMLGASRLLALLFSRLTAVWGVTQANLHLAPAWVRVIAGQYEVWAGAAQSLLLLPLAALLARVLTKKRLARGRGALWGLLGLAAGAALVALLRLADAVRFGWSLAQPRVGLAVLAPLALCAASALGGEALFRGVLLELEPGVPDWLAMGVSALAFALMSAARLPVSLLNAALLGLALCLLYRRTRGIRAGALFRFSLDALLYGVMGCAGGATGATGATGVAGAAYETYPSQLDLLSGGSAGPMNGLAATALLVVIVVAVGRRLGGGAPGMTPRA